MIFRREGNPHLRRRKVGDHIRHGTSRVALAAATMCHRAARVTSRYPFAERRQRMYVGLQRRVKIATERTKHIAKIDFPSSVLLLALTVLLPLVTFIAAFKITSHVWQDEVWKKKGAALSYWTVGSKAILCPFVILSLSMS